MLHLVVAHPFLNVIDDEHVDALIEVDEIIKSVLSRGVAVLHVEQPRTDVEHAFLRIELHDAVADGVGEVRLSAARRSVDEHRVELAVVRMLGYRLSHAARQFVAVALNEVGESLSRIELRVEFLRLCGVECRGRLVGASFRLLGAVFDWVTLQNLRDLVGAVGHDAIGQPHALAERAPQNLRE